MRPARISAMMSGIGLIARTVPGTVASGLSIACRRVGFTMDAMSSGERALYCGRSGEQQIQRRRRQLAFAIGELGNHAVVVPIGDDQRAAGRRWTAFGPALP